MLAGCASIHKTTKTETTITYSNEAASNKGEEKTTMTVSTSSDQQNKGVVEKSRTTTTTDTKTEHPGIISSTFHAIGYVISFPDSNFKCNSMLVNLCGSKII
jgi:hypothetical protein